MSTTARATASPRTTPPLTSSPRVNSLQRGATARAAVSPRVAGASPAQRRASLKSATPPPPNGQHASDSQTEALLSSLTRETEEKEKLLIRVQERDEAITNLTKDNDHLTSTLNAVEGRVNELYEDQARMEDDLAARLEIIEKLRVQVRELEKEKRDSQRRYNEQTQSFEAERKAFYDNEQHLKSRIQSLMNASTAAETNQSEKEKASYVEPELEYPPARSPVRSGGKVAESGPESQRNAAQVTALQTELSTLSTSHASLQNTLQLLQSQLSDLRGVNKRLQEENESYNILLTEKTLSGRYDIWRQVGSSGAGEDDEDEDSSLFSSNRPPLETVNEETEDVDPAADESLLDPVYENNDDDEPPETARPKRRKNARSRSSSPAPRGESLAGLPLSGPGLDLAAELGRAENTNVSANIEAPPVSSKKLRKTASYDVDSLRSEVKSLKDANKALSLYASKIIDRIIAQEGFEHVLAADYDSPPVTPSARAQPKVVDLSTPAADSPVKKPRPQSLVFQSNVTDLSRAAAAATSPTGTPSKASRPAEEKRESRRSLSFDWRSFSLFGGSGESAESKKPELRPLTLRPGAAPVVNARKVETHEDEDDRRERARLDATMKLMGIEKPLSPVAAAPIHHSFTSPGALLADSASERISSPKEGAFGSRWPFFRSRSSNNSDTASVKSASTPNAALTQDAVSQADAESTLAELDAREKALSVELAKGQRSGFTELGHRGSLTEEWKSKRSKRSASGAGSVGTVWSAGET